jgi:hypothetical protein
VIQTWWGGRQIVSSLVIGGSGDDGGDGRASREGGDASVMDLLLTGELGVSISD